MSTFKITGQNSTASPNVGPEGFRDTSVTVDSVVAITLKSTALHSAEGMGHKDEPDSLKTFSERFKLRETVKGDAERTKANEAVTAFPRGLATAATQAPITNLPADISAVATAHLTSPVKSFSTLRLKPTPKWPAPVLTGRPQVSKIQTRNALPDEHRHALERKLGYIFADPNLLWEALQAHGNGVKIIGDRKIEDGNKKLALLGDCVVKMAVLNDWFETGESRRKSYPNLSQELTIEG